MPDTRTPLSAKLPDHITLRALTQAPFSIVLTNAAIEDNPLIYVNSAFEEVTGYNRDAIIGKNCRFLQGKESDPEAVAQIREAVSANRHVTVDLVNYRADGTPFLNRLSISPIESSDPEDQYFLGIQVDLGDTSTSDGSLFNDLSRSLSEMQHRVKNHLSMIVSMIRLQANRGTAREEFDTIARRVETLQILYEEMNDRPDNSRQNDSEVALGAYISRVGNAIAHLDGRHGVRVNVETDAVSVPFETASRIGLAASEVLTNAMQHAFEGREQGTVDVRLQELVGAGVIRLQIADDGIGLPEGLDWPDSGSLGGRIVEQLIDGLDAQLSVAQETVGTAITIDIPNPTKSDG